MALFSICWTVGVNGFYFIQYNSLHVLVLLGWEVPLDCPPTLPVLHPWDDPTHPNKNFRSEKLFSCFGT